MLFKNNTSVKLVIIRPRYARDVCCYAAVRTPVARKNRPGVSYTDYLEVAFCFFLPQMKVRIYLPRTRGHLSSQFS